MLTRCTIVLAIVAAGAGCGLADDPVFSGPQPGEPLSAFQIISVYGDEAGKEVDPVDMAGGKPLLLVFVHNLTRPGAALMRGLASFAQQQEGAASAIVWLDDDRAEAEDYLTRAKKSLNFVGPVGVSVDGGEGPGSYGLNRNVELTVIIADDNKVTSNYALVQPSVTEGPKIAADLAQLLSQPAPSDDEFQKLAYPGGNMKRRAQNMRRPSSRQEKPGDLRSMMRKMVAPDATEPEIQKAIKAIDDWTGGDPMRQQQLARMCAAVLERGMGSADVQATIKNWRDKYKQR